MTPGMVQAPALSAFIPLPPSGLMEYPPES